MILNDAEIRRRIAADQLLSQSDDANIHNCAYILRAGAVFRPKTGEQELLAPKRGLWRRPVVWEIGPSETLIVRTTERVKMPTDLCATYAPLHRLARQGIMLLNASIVEPAYEGPLSCFLANFSAQPVTLRPDAPIAKILFHALNATPATLKPLTTATDKYEQDLAEYAKRYHQSFLDIAGITERAAKEARGALKGWVITGSVLIAMLLAWASLEPILSKWLWDRYGIMSLPQRVEDTKLLKDLQEAQNTIKLLMERQRTDEDLRAQVNELKAQVAKLRGQR